MFVKLCHFFWWCETTELEEQLENADARISQEDSHLTYWKHFRDKGQHENDKTIRLLEQELIDMEASFTEISGMVVSVYL